MKDITEAFTSARPSTKFVDSDLNDDDDEDVENNDTDNDENKTENENVKNELTDSVKLVSTRVGSKDSVGDKERIKAGIMTTNKKVMQIFFEGYFPKVYFCPGPDPVPERRLVWL